MRKFLIIFLAIVIGTTFIYSTDTKYFYSRPVISPDGNTILFNYNDDIWYVPSKGGIAAPLTYNPGYDSSPVWSSDNKQIIFASSRNGYRNIFKMSFPNGTPKQIDNSNKWGYPSSWQGDYLLLNFYTVNGFSLYVKDMKRNTKPIKNSFDNGFSGVFSPDGKRIAYIRGSQDYPRKDYHGSANFNIWIKNTDSKYGEIQLTKYDGADLRPVWSNDGNTIYFLSDRDGYFNVWSKNIRTGELKQLTHLKQNVLYISKAVDAPLLALDIESEIYILNLLTLKLNKVNIILKGGDYHFPLTEIKNVDENITEVEILPDNENIALVSYGELYLKPLDYKGVINLSNSPSRDWNIFTSNDSVNISFCSFRNGYSNVYVINSKTKKIKQITDTDQMIDLFEWSPNGRYFIYQVNEDFYRYDNKHNKSKLLFTDKHLYNIHWLTNDWLLCHYTPNDDADELKLYNIKKDEFHQITYSYYWKKFVGLDEENELIFVEKGVLKKILLQKPKEKFSEEEGKNKKDNKKSKNKENSELKIEFRYIRNRVKNIVQMDNKISYARLSHDGKKIAFYIYKKQEIWTVNIDGSKKKKLTNIQAKNIRWSADDKSLFVISHNSLYKISISGKKEKISFDDEYFVNKKVNYLQLYREAWATLKNRFYDANMHGVDWDAIYKKYLPFVKSTMSNTRFGLIMNMVVGELKASHMGYWNDNDYTAKKTKGSGYLGLYYDELYDGFGYKVMDILPTGPCDKDGVNIKKGDYIVAIDDSLLTPQKSIQELLWRKIGKKTKIMYNDEPDTNGAKVAYVKPISRWKFSRLNSDYKIYKRKELVSKESDNKILYIHIKSMNDRSLEKFRQEYFSELKGKKALIIDVRDNGGGRIHEELFNILNQKPFAYETPRHFDDVLQPPTYFNGPIVLLINERSYSDAEIFPLIFREGGFGTIIGVPTNGSVIGTISYHLMDNSTLRLPVNGWYDLKHRNMENFGVKPDIYVENTPKDLANDFDRQLDTAIKYLLQKLNK